MNLTSEINQFQDEIREGYVPEKKPAPDYGEPWHPSNVFGLEVIEDKSLGIIADFQNPNVRDRIVACVNACAGMADPSAEIQAMRDAIKDHLDAFAWMDGPEGWTEACQKLQLFIKP